MSNTYEKMLEGKYRREIEEQAQVKKLPLHSCNGGISVITHLK
jgi:hypothetical protein